MIRDLLESLQEQTPEVINRLSTSVHNLKESDDDDVELSVTLSGPRRCIDQVKDLLGALQFCNAGCSRTFKLDWDGDGSDWLKIVQSSEEVEASTATVEQIGNHDTVNVSGSYKDTKSKE